MSKAKQAPDVLRDFKVAPVRKRQYTSDRDGFEVAQLSSDDAVVTVYRGKRARDGMPYFYTVSGTQHEYLPVCAVGTILATGLVSPTEYVSLLGVPDEKAAEVAKAIDALIAEASGDTE